MWNAAPAAAATDIAGRVADLTQLASLDARHVEGHVDGTYLHLPAGVPPKLERERVAAVDFAGLDALYGIARLGYLALDVEALDCQLLLSFPFHATRPLVVSFEHAHCDGPFSRDAAPASWVLLNRTRALLAAYGYELADATEAGDATYVRADLFPELAFPDPLPWASNVSFYTNGRCKRPWLRWGKRWS